MVGKGKGLGCACSRNARIGGGACYRGDAARLAASGSASDGECVMAGDYVLAIDQGTTSSRAIVFNHDSATVGETQREFTQHYPRPGWVEHDADEIWEVTLGVMREALEEAGISAGDIAAIGITNQRETVVMWDKETGEPVHNAIVWQDRRGAQICTQLSEEGYDDMVANKTGLVIDAYFSGSKVRWLLENVDGLKERG